MSHSLTIQSWWEDHKRGWARLKCEGCDWEGAETYPASRSSWHETKLRFLAEWRQHLPADWQPTFGTVRHENGDVSTGQAEVVIEGEDYVLRALSTHMGPRALEVRGFWGDIGLLEDAEDCIFPLGRVKKVISMPWYDLSDVWECSMPRPAEAGPEIEE